MLHMAPIIMIIIIIMLIKKRKNKSQAVCAASYLCFLGLYFLPPDLAD